MDDLVTWLRAQLDDDERVARAASSGSWGQTESGEHWHWVETEHDVPVNLDPVVDEYVNDGSGVALRSVEQYPTSSSYTLPNFVISEAEEVPTTCGMHIARWDPARVLAEVDAKRRILADVVPQMDGMDDQINGEWGMGPIASEDYASVSLLKLLALPYAARPGYREEWRP